MIGYYDQLEGINSTEIQQKIQHLMDELLLHESNDDSDWRDRIHKTIEKVVQ